MESASAFNIIKSVQAAFKLLAVLQLVTYMWPKQAIVNDGDRYDFIIVGAGTAGSVIDNRLSENEKVKVLVIEAGDDPPFESDIPRLIVFLKGSQYDWNYTTVDNHQSDQCHQNPYFEMSLGKMLGGTSSLNYMAYTRGHPSDYDSWAKIVQDSTWEWKNVLKYFIKSEKLMVPEIINSPNAKYHGTDGYVGITKEDSADTSNYLDAFKELGSEVVLDLNPDHPLGYTNFLITLADGHRQTSAKCFLSTAKDRSNIHVLKNTLVTKVIIESDRATGVEALTSDDKLITIKAEKEVIISAGVFNSPKLLMLSGIGPEEHLKSLNIDVVKKLPVGENLQDHVGVILYHAMEKLKKPEAPMDPLKFPAIAFKGLVALNNTQNYPDYLTLNYVVGPEIVMFYCSYAYRFNHKICYDLYAGSRNDQGVFTQVIDIAPKTRGKVLLRSKNPADAPVINVEYFSKDEDMENIVDYVQHFTGIVNTTYFKSVDTKFVDPIPSRCKEFAHGSREYWRCYSRCISSSTSHYTSTCAMGSVLDGKLKVLGIEGLRVADASVMPTITRADPGATVIMIGEKASMFIKKEYGL